MAQGSEGNIGERQERTCTSTNCPKAKKTGVPCGKKKNSVFKYKLDENDNKDKYLLVTGRIYITKSSIDLPQEPAPQQIRTEHILENEKNIEDEKEILTLNLKPEEEINGFELWKNCCKEGICSINELLCVCEKNPDSVMAACRRSWTKDKGVPTVTLLKSIHSDESQSQIKMTHGIILGDAKYHFLMVDARTSMTAFGIAEKKVSPLTSVLKKPFKALDEESISPSEIREILGEPRIEEESVRQLEFDEEWHQGLADMSLEETRVSEVSLDKEHKTNIGWSKDVANEDESKKYFDRKRISTVVWSGISPSPPSSSESGSVIVSKSITLDPAIEAAGAKTDDFRKNVTIKKHNSLLGVIIEQEIKRPRPRRKSVIDHDQVSAGSGFTRCCGLIKVKEKKKNFDKSSPDQPPTSEEDEVSRISQSDSSSKESASTSGQSTPHNSRGQLSKDDNKSREENDMTHYLDHI